MAASLRAVGAPKHLPEGHATDGPWSAIGRPCYLGGESSAVDGVVEGPQTGDANACRPPARGAPVAPAAIDLGRSAAVVDPRAGLSSDRGGGDGRGSVRGDPLVDR